MKELIKYMGVGLLCVAGATASCKDKKEELSVVERPPIVEDIKNGVTGKTFKVEYTILNGRLRSSNNEFVESYQDNCIARYNGSIPGAMVTCVYDQDRRISVQFTHNRTITSTIDDSIDSTSVQEYRTRFEKDKALLKQAGIF